MAVSTTDSPASLGQSLIQGPDWCKPGLPARAGRYPLAAEEPVMAAVDMLVPACPR